jgi:hypothetical protein
MRLLEAGRMGWSTKIRRLGDLQEAVAVVHWESIEFRSLFELRVVGVGGAIRH